jgi:hypothetical protein
VIHQPPADVVARQRVFAAGITKSYDEFHVQGWMRKRAGELPAL